MDLSNDNIDLSLGKDSNLFNNDTNQNNKKIYVHPILFIPLQ